MDLKLLFVSINWNGHSIAIRFNEGKLLITKTGCQTFCWLFLEEIDCTTCLAPIFILLKLPFLMGFASFPEFQIKNELLKIAYLIALNKCHHLKTGCLMIVLRPIMYRYKDADIDILYTYTRIIAFMCVYVYIYISIYIYIYICICYVFYVVI